MYGKYEIFDYMEEIGGKATDELGLSPDFRHLGSQAYVGKIFEILGQCEKESPILGNVSRSVFSDAVELLEDENSSPEAAALVAYMYQTYGLEPRDSIEEYMRFASYLYEE